MAKVGLATGDSKGTDRRWRWDYLGTGCALAVKDMLVIPFLRC